MQKEITPTIKYIGVDDRDIDLFESQYEVPNGIAYNSYLIEAEQLCIMDTADARKGEEWLANLEEALSGRAPQYLVMHHMEPDHASMAQEAANKYPEMKIVMGSKAVKIFNNFFPGNAFADRIITVDDGSELDLGDRKLHFIGAAMVHWPEVVMSYDDKEKVLFSADGFGKFGALDADEDWACEARRYYFNICGKYGAAVQKVLKAAAQLEIKIICPLHGPILTENLGYYINLYDIWSSYGVETEGVLIAYASIHGGTKAVAEKVADMFREKNIGKVAITDLCRDDMAEAIEDAFRMNRLVVAAASYDASVFPPMYNFIHKLQIKGYQNRKVGIIENGSWAPTAAKTMRPMLEAMKDVEIIDPVVTIWSRMKDADVPQLQALVNNMC